MAITEKIIRHLPDFYQAQIRRKLLFKLIDVAGLQLQEVENNFAEIIKSHFIDYADLNRLKPYDLAKIGALFNVLPGEQEETEAYRRRLRNTIRLYLGGLGTSDAMIRISTLTFDLDVPRKSYPNGNEIITRPECGFPPLDRFTTKANLYLPDSAPLFDEVNFDEVDFEKSLWMEVIDNPPVPQRYTKWVHHGMNWETLNDSVIDCSLDLRINAQFRSLKFPTLTNRSTGQIVRFVGIVPQDQVLRVYLQDEDRVTAFLNSTDVTKFVEVIKGALFDRDRFDLGYFAGEKVLPLVPKKRSKWHFGIASAVFGADEIESVGAWIATGASFVADGIDRRLVPDKDRFAVNEDDEVHAKFAIDQRDLFSGYINGRYYRNAYFELLEVGEFDENKNFGENKENATVVFGGLPFAQTQFDWDAREPASFQIRMTGDNLLDVVGLEISGAYFVEDGVTDVPLENEFNSGRFAVDPRDQLIINVENIKAAGIKAAVTFQ